MEILVCVKQVPDDSVEVKFNEAAGKPEVDSIATVVNAFDGYALEMAARFKEANGGSITVIAVGDDKVKDALRNCLAVGADQAYQVVADVAELDTLATAKVLAQAVAKIEAESGKKFDIICTGKESTDIACGQAGAQMAVQLGLGQVADVIAFEVKEAELSVKKETEEGYNMLDVALPCVLSITKPDYDPRYPTMKSKMAARKKDIPAITVEGTDLSPVKVIKMYTPAKKAAGVKIKEETTEESAIKAVAMMLDAKVL